MKKFAIAAVAMVFAGAAFAQGKTEVKGDVSTNVKVGAAVQNSQGIGNKQSANIGGVDGNTKVGGNVKTNVQAGAVVQNTQGIGNEQKMNLGGVGSK